MTPPTPPSSTEQTFWDSRYSETEWAYGQEPNDFVREQSKVLPPGDALCLAEGQGRNAVFLASLGHRVIAQDLSPVGLNCASKLAATRGLSLLTICADLRNYVPTPESVDLVVAIWMHLPKELRHTVHRRAITALRPGGHLLLEAYTPDQLGLATGGPPVRELLMDPEDLQRDLEGLTFKQFRCCERLVEEGPYHRGNSAVVQVLGQKPVMS